MAYAGPSFTLPKNVSEDFKKFVQLKARGGNLSGLPLSLDQRKEIDRELARISKGWPEHVRMRAELAAGAEDLAKDYRSRMPAAHKKAFTLPQVKEALARRLKEAFAGKKIAVRVTESSLGAILLDGRFKTQHEVVTTSIGTLYSPVHRRTIEAALYGIPESGFDPRRRPVYGYVATAGTGNLIQGQEVSAYGSIEIVLKDDVRARTTAMVGDSLNDRNWAQPSPVDNPSWESARPMRGWMGEVGVSDDFERSEFHMYHYAEAQIHDGVSVSDIEEVIFTEQPRAATKAELAKSGISWRVVIPRVYDHGNA